MDERLRRVAHHKHYQATFIFYWAVTAQDFPYTQARTIPTAFLASFCLHHRLRHGSKSSNYLQCNWYIDHNHRINPHMQAYLTSRLSLSHSCLASQWTLVHWLVASHIHSQAFSLKASYSIHISFLLYISTPSPVPSTTNPFHILFLPQHQSTVFPSQIRPLAFLDLQRCEHNIIIQGFTLLNFLVSQTQCSNVFAEMIMLVKKRGMFHKRLTSVVSYSSSYLREPGNTSWRLEFVLFLMSRSFQKRSDIIVIPTSVIPLLSVTGPQLTTPFLSTIWKLFLSSNNLSSSFYIFIIRNKTSFRLPFVTLMLPSSLLSFIVVHLHIQQPQNIGSRSADRTSGGDGKIRWGGMDPGADPGNSGARKRNPLLLAR